MDNDSTELWIMASMIVPEQYEAYLNADVSCVGKFSSNADKPLSEIIQSAGIYQQFCDGMPFSRFVDKHPELLSKMV